MRQRIIIISLALMNFAVYGVLAYCLLVLLPQDQSRPQPQLIALSSTALPLIPTPTHTVAPSATPVPPDTPTPTNTDTPTATPTLVQSTLENPAGPSPTPTATQTPTRSVVATAAARRSAPALIRKPTAAPTKQPAAPSPKGDSPGNALMPNGPWLSLAPGASVWYRVGGPGEHIEVFLQARPLSSMRMDVFAPGNFNRPIGRGSFEAALDRIVWSGGHWNSWGDWFALVANSGPAAAQYHVSTNTRVIGTCETISYWEWIGPNLVYWTRCK